MGVCEVLIPLTNSPSIEVQSNSATALANLSFKGGRTTTDEYSAFSEVWDMPEGGMHNYLYRFLNTPDATFQHVAVWTIIQLLESGDPRLITKIRSSPLLVPHIRQLATSRDSTPSSSVGTPHSVRSPSEQEMDAAWDQEIQLLSTRILEFIDGDIDLSMTPGVTPSLGHVASSVDGSATGRDHDKLKRSVQKALAQNH